MVYTWTFDWFENVEGFITWFLNVQYMHNK